LSISDYLERGLVGAEGGGDTSPLLAIDEDLLHLMENESLLIDKECLTLGKELGKGLCVLLFTLDPGVEKVCVFCFLHLTAVHCIFLFSALMLKINK
jgi:hypothetical protein